MAQFYQCSIVIFYFIMALITKLLKKSKVFDWTIECQTTWKRLRTGTLKISILINPN